MKEREIERKTDRERESDRERERRSPWKSCDEFWRERKPNCTTLDTFQQLVFTL